MKSRDLSIHRPDRAVDPRAGAFVGAAIDQAAQTVADRFREEGARRERERIREQAERAIGTASAVLKRENDASMPRLWLCEAMGDVLSALRPLLVARAEQGQPEEQGEAEEAR